MPHRRLQTNRHSASVTGVIDSRLPRCRTRIAASSGWRRSSSSAIRRCLARSVTSTLQPARRGARGLGVEVGALRIELRFVGIGRPRDFGQTGDAGLRAARVIEEHAVADAHLVAHEVARLVVAHADPGHGLARRRVEVVDRALGRLALHQPVLTRHGGAESGGCPSRTGSRIPEPRVQVGEVSPALGSSDARRSRLPDDVPSPSSARASVQGNIRLTRAQRTKSFYAATRRASGRIDASTPQISQQLAVGAERQVEPANEGCNVHVRCRRSSPRLPDARRARRRGSARPARRCVHAP